MSELTSSQPTPEELKAQYREALTIANDYFRRAEQIQDYYDNYSVFSNTGSDTRFPLIYQLTEEILPGLWFGLFPRDKMIRLSERWGSGADFERIKAAETYLHFLIKHSGIRSEGLKTVKDAIKFGKGYGMVEMRRVSIPEEIMIVLANAATGEVATSAQTVQSVRYMPRYIHLEYPYVVPTPDGDSPESVSGVFVLRFYREAELIAMYEADAALPEQHRKLKLSAEQVLRYTAEHQLDAATFDPAWIMGSIAGMDNVVARMRGMASIIRQLNSDRERNAKGRMLTVPVLQCKYHNQEYWLANGQQLIYSVDAGGSQTCMDVVAASANKDSGDWWAQGPVTASGDLHEATNIVWRMLLDTVARAGDPIKIINEILLPNAPDDLPPGTTLHAKGLGDLRNAFTYVQPPPLPEGFAGLNAAFAEQASRTVGRPMQLSGQGGAGIMRGGSAAFESWLATATGREKLMSSIIQTDWLVPSIELIMRQAQLVMPARLQFSMGAEDIEPAERRIHSITRADFAREYDVEIDPDAKYDLSTQELALRLNQGQILIDDPDFDQRAVKEYMLGDTPAVARLRATPEVRARQIEELQARAEREQQAREGGTQGAEMQGVVGGMARQQQEAQAR